MKPLLIIHGGLSPGNDPHLAEKKAKIRDIAQKAYAFLLQNSALDTVTYAVQLLEDEPVYNAGTGAELQADGEARLSASLNDGETDQFSGVVNIEHIKNPILVAKCLLKEKNKVLSSQEAIHFALSKGFKKEIVKTSDSIERWQKKMHVKSDTVGACALDAQGRLACATSTGGSGGEIPGRVSDSCTPAGGFATKICAVSTTGQGEQILNECMAAKIVIRTQDMNSIKTAFAKSFEEVRSKKAEIGAIGIDKDGNIQWDEANGILVFAQMGKD
jgi:L-asparaginase